MIGHNCNIKTHRTESDLFFQRVVSHPLRLCVRIGSRSPCRPDSQIPFGMSAEPAGYQLGPFEVGQTKAHAHHGLSAAAISRIVTKPDFTDRTILRTTAKINGDPAWRGEKQTGSGRLRKTTVKLDSPVCANKIETQGAASARRCR